MMKSTRAKIGAVIHVNKGMPGSMTSARVLPHSSRGRIRASAAVDILLWVALCVLLSVCFANIQHISEWYPGISLRFDKQVSGQAAYSARAYSIKHSDEETFWPTFWQEEKVSISSEYAQMETNGIFFSGDANLVWPAEYITGTAPGVTDSIGCAMSLSLALQLWGGADVYGKMVEIDETAYIIRGVFEGESDIVLISVGDENVSRDFNAAELTRGPDGATRDEITNYSVASGLGSPNVILNGSPEFIAGIMAIVPLFIMGVYAVGMLIGWLWKGRRIARQIVVFVFLLGFAALLPTLLDAMPDWLIPGSWSDFSFWESLIQQFDNRIMEFLHMNPQIRDAEGKLLLLNQACIAYLSTICALIVCFRWHITLRNKIFADTAQLLRNKSIGQLSEEKKA